MRIRIPLGGKELAQARFAISPVYETVFALAALIRPGVHAVHLPWARWARDRVDRIDPLLLALLRRDDGKPAFLLPPPDTRLPDIDAELARVRAVSYVEAAAEAAHFTSRKLDLDRVATELKRVYELIVAPHWDRMSRVLDADITFRSGILATGGMERLFQDLHHDVRWSDGELIIRPDHPGEKLVELRGHGMVLCPSVFCWPRVTASTRPAGEGTLRYPARGVATLWETPEPAPQALASLIGRTRAAILMELSAPMTTADLAGRLGVTAGAVSQHLTVLRQAGLVTTHRDARFALHLRTPASEVLTVERTVDDRLG